MKKVLTILTIIWVFAFQVGAYTPLTETELIAVQKITDRTAKLITEDTKDKAYDAPASALVGKWFNNHWQEVTISANGVYTCESPSSVNGDPIIEVETCKWTKKGHEFRLVKTGWQYKPDPEFEKGLSPRKKQQYREAISLKSSLYSKKRTIGESLTFEIDYLKDGVLVLRFFKNFIFATKKAIQKEVEMMELSAKNAEIVAEAKAKAERTALDNKIMTMLPKNIVASIEAGDMDVATAAKSVKTLTIPSDMQIVDGGIFSYFPVLDSLNIPSTVKKLSGNNSTVKVLTLGSPTTELSDLKVTKIHIQDKVTIDNHGPCDIDKCIVLGPSEQQEKFESDVIEHGKKIINDYVVVAQGNPTNMLFRNYNMNQLHLVGLIVRPPKPGWKYRSKREQSIYGLPKRGFQNDLRLAYVELPDSFWIVQEGTFYNCPSLKQINLPKRIEKIEANAFGKTGLTSITLPATLKEIGDGAFGDCKSLSVVELECPSAVISPSAFAGDDYLKSVIIGDGFQNIETLRFPSAQIAYFKGTVPPKVKNVFPKTATAYVPESALEAYTKAFKGKFANIIGVSENQKIGDIIK